MFFPLLLLQGFRCWFFVCFLSPEDPVYFWDYNFETRISSSCHAGQQLAEEQLSLHLMVYIRCCSDRTGRMPHMPLARSPWTEPPASEPCFWNVTSKSSTLQKLRGPTGFPGNLLIIQNHTSGGGAAGHLCLEVTS